MYSAQHFDNGFTLPHAMMFPDEAISAKFGQFSPSVLVDKTSALPHDPPTFLSAITTTESLKLFICRCRSRSSFSIARTALQRAARRLEPEPRPSTTT